MKSCSAAEMRSPTHLVLQMWKKRTKRQTWGGESSSSSSIGFFDHQPPAESFQDVWLWFGFSQPPWQATSTSPGGPVVSRYFRHLEKLQTRIVVFVGDCVFKKKKKKVNTQASSQRTRSKLRSYDNRLPTVGLNRRGKKQNCVTLPVARGDVLNFQLLGVDRLLQ